MDIKTIGTLVLILLFLISFLINLLQRRYHRNRIDRLLQGGESQLNFLDGLHASLGKLESACTFEMDIGKSPKNIGKSIHIARNQIKSSISELEKTLRSFRRYRREEKARERHWKRVEKVRKKRLGK
ncbi:MAG: hypothetical protein GTN81_10675 [Proteobacteria bacterium]|nr:hypothetical protein [Pseudomonadota bacterium]